MARKVSTANLDTMYYGAEPSWNPAPKDFPLAVLKALNWYTSQSNSSSYAKWISAWMKSKDYPKDQIELIGDKYSPSASTDHIAYYCRMSELGAVLPSEIESKIRKFVESMIAVATSSARVKAQQIATNTEVVVEEVESPEKKATVADRIREQMKVLIGRLEEYTDASFRNVKTGNQPVCFNFVEWLKQFRVKSTQSNYIAAYYEAIAADLQTSIAAGGEGYHLKVKTLKELHAYFTGMANTARGFGADHKKSYRQPRKRKTKPAAEQVRKVKFLVKSDTFGIESISPTKIIGAEKLVMFNVKNRKVTFLEAQDRGGLGVKGTTVTGFDPKKSFSKKLRKPQDLFKVTKSGENGVRAVKNAINQQNAKEGPAKGRIGADVILVGVY